MENIVIFISFLLAVLVVYLIRRHIRYYHTSNFTTDWVFVNVCEGCMIIGTNRYRSPYDECPKCGCTHLLMTHEVARWVSIGELWDEYTWGKGYWEFKESHVSNKYDQAYSKLVNQNGKQNDTAKNKEKI